MNSNWHEKYSFVEKASKLEVAADISLFAYHVP